MSLESKYLDMIGMEDKLICHIPVSDIQELNTFSFNNVYF